MVTSSAVVGSSAIEQLRLAGDRHRDHHALAHAARQLVRILAGAPRRGRDADGLEQVEDAEIRIDPRQAEMAAEHLGDLRAHPDQRIERRHRVLEDERDLLAADLAGHARSRPGEERLALPADVAARDAAGHVDQPHHRLGGDALARSRFADDGERLAAADGEIDAAKPADDAAPGVELNFEPLDLEERPVGGGVHAASRWTPARRSSRRRAAALARAKRFSRSCGSVVTRSQLAKRLMERTVIEMQRPGKVTSHHATKM